MWLGRRRGVSLGSFLFARLDRQMMPDCAPGNGAENRVVMREVTGDGSNGGAFETAGFARRCQTREKQKRGAQSRGLSGHRMLLSAAHL
jgi:hypothetical protein